MTVKKMWETLSQPGELEFHQGNTWRTSPDFIIQNSYELNLFGYTADSWDEKIVIDLGCGSKLRSKFFTHAKIIAIDPLARKFLKTIAWSDLKEAYKVYSRPAESFVTRLQNTADFIMCINVLDHVYNADKVLQNCYNYLKEDGEFLLSVDMHGEADPLHPIHLEKDMLDELLQKTGFTTIRTYEGLGTYGPHYGNGVAHTYILKKQNGMAAVP